MAKKGLAARAVTAWPLSLVDWLAHFSDLGRPPIVLEFKSPELLMVSLLACPWLAF